MNQPAAANQKRPTRQKQMVLVAVCLPLFVLAMDNSVLNLALPPISRDLGSSASQLQWITDAYILVFGALLLASGAIGDRYGRKRVLQIGLIMFGVGSLGAALSTSSGMLIFFRGFLGIPAAMVMPSTLSILVDTFRDPKERVQAIGIWTAIFILGSGIGPLVGGYLLDYFHWSAVFFINLPVVVISLILAYFFIGESKGENVQKPDILGMILSIIGLFVLVYGIIEAGMKGWGDSAVLTYLGIGILVLILFSMWENRIAQPMLPIRFFKNMSLTVASLAMVLTLFTMAGSLFLLSQYFQSVQGYSPIAAAIRTLPIALISFPLLILSPRIIGKIGIKPSLTIGIFIIGTSLFYLSQIVEEDSSYPPLFVGFVILAVGMGLTSVPATNYIVGSIPVSRAGVASGVNNATRQVGQALGVAVLGSVMNAVYRDEIGEIPVLSSLTEDTIDAVRSSIQTAHIAAGELPVDTSGIIKDGANSAFALGMTDAMFVGALILWGTALFTLVFLPRRIQCHD